MQSTDFLKDNDIIWNSKTTMQISDFVKTHNLTKRLYNFQKDIGIIRLLISQYKYMNFNKINCIGVKTH